MIEFIISAIFLLAVLREKCSEVMDELLEVDDIVSRLARLAQGVSRYQLFLALSKFCFEIEGNLQFISDM